MKSKKIFLRKLKAGSKIYCFLVRDKVVNKKIANRNNADLIFYGLGIGWIYLARFSSLQGAKRSLGRLTKSVVNKSAIKDVYYSKPVLPTIINKKRGKNNDKKTNRN